MVLLPRKYDIEKVLATFATASRNEVGMEWLSVALLHMVEETVYLVYVSLWPKPSKRGHLEREPWSSGLNPLKY
ncbi:MAG TPA: hypothetical protein VJ436_09070 [Anaerolineales bacterium]|nr:hypothetical protein [Anaerolineales bacterium]